MSVPEGGFGRRRRFVLASCSGLVLLAAASASPLLSTAAPTQARRLTLGLLGDPVRFRGETGQESRVRLIIVGWGQGGTSEYFERLFATMAEEPMLGVSAGPLGGSISPESIARGAGDSYLASINQAVADWRKPILIRPFAEMNGYWNSYSAFNKDGSARGADHSTAWFRKAFARVYLALHGGPRVNSDLHRLGLPPIAEPLSSNASVKVVWNPQGYGDPDVPQNSAGSYYPGDAYVDVVGDDLYDIGGKAEWTSAEALYDAHPHKPFAFPEWALWNLDDPGFVDEMAAFVRSHPRVDLISYYSGASGSLFDLASKPRSRAEYARVITPLGR
jgi:hypothetical protein